MIHGMHPHESDTLRFRAAWLRLGRISLGLALGFSGSMAEAQLPSTLRSSSATKDGSAPNYFVRVWQSDDGLPQNAVSAVIQARDGYLWVGTYNGLVRFDGVRFTVFDHSNTAELPNNRVTSLFEADDASLWIGHETGELTRLQAGRFETVSLPGGWQGRKIVGIQSDDLQDIWLQGDDGSLARVRDGLMLTPPSGNAPGLVNLVKGEGGSIWVLSAGLVAVLERGELKPMNFDGAATNIYVQGLAPSRRGGMWVASDGRLRRWMGTKWAEDLGESPWGLAALVDLIETQDGFLAAATSEQGLYLVSPQAAVLHFNRTNGFPSDWLRCLQEDREGNLWVGAGGSGLAVVRGSKAATVNAPDAWQGRPVLSVSVGKDDALWIATEGAGIYRLRAGEWTHFGESSGLANLFVWSVAEDARGQVWAGTWGGGLFIKRDAQFERATGLEDFTAPTPALLHRPDGSCWVGSGEGLLLYESGKPIIRYGREQGLALPDVRAVVEDKQGRVWFGMSGGGLGLLENGAVRQFRKADGLASDFVWCLQLDEEGALWIGTAGGGLSRLKDGRFANIGTSQGLPNTHICHIADDGQGYFWMSSHQGIIRASKAELRRCADGQIPTMSWLTYGTGDGLPTLESSGGSQPAGCRTADGRLWFATSRGLAVLNPLDVKTNQLAPPVIIEELRVDGRVTDIRGATNTPLRIPPGRNRLEIHYTGLSFVVPEKVRFKYRLDGLQSEWEDAGNERRVNYSYVPPGNYTFHVIACNNDEVWNELGAKLAFIVLPHFWQTWWFRTAIGLAAVASVSAMVWFDTRRRMRHELERAERQRAVERERTRIAKDIHDDLGASLTRITMLSQTARSELDQPEQAALDLDRIYGTARELTRAMDEIVWAVNPQHDTLDSLATYLGRFAQDYLQVAGIRCRLDVPLRLPSWPLTAEVRHNLFLAFKEALHNTVKHAAASEVRVSLALKPLGFVLTLADNGRGFSPVALNREPSSEGDRVASGNGLANMRRRLVEIGGHCDIQSRSGTGTTIAFAVDVSVAAS
ncbi:MAG: ATP-binding protein [Verrucomicrobia bacterium]|nr:ATP-binding protein [Verrucomicrobiota bacterium]